MTITRLFQAHGEYGNGSHLYEWTFASSGSINTSNPHTGAASYSNAASVYYRKTLPSVCSQGRLSFWFHHNDVSSGDKPRLFSFRKSSAHKLEIFCDATTLSLEIGGVEKASETRPAGWTTGEWHRIGFDFKIAASGWAVLYIDEEAVLTFEGDTTGGGSDFDEFQILNNSFTVTWASTNYFDDFYLDDTAGEATYASPPDVRFARLLPTGNGTENDFTASGAGDNYQQVDDESATGDTDYVYASSAGLDDRYTHDAYSVPEGFQIEAVIYAAALRRTSGAIATTAILTGKNGGDEYASDEITPTTSTVAYFDRQTTSPSGAAWTADALNATEFGVRSAGDYS